ncbi:MAG: hypothetical protein ACI4QG_07220 [Candidatus Cryptobacteroides sp.]
MKNTATYENAKSTFKTTATIADIQVSDTKVVYTYVPSKMVQRGGYDNVINTAVREAVKSAGDYDVLVAKETQVRYKSGSRKIKTVIVSGYPGKYTNWRSSDEVVDTTPRSIFRRNKK